MILHLITFMETKTFATSDAKLAAFFKHLVLTHSVEKWKICITERFETGNLEFRYPIFTISPSFFSKDYTRTWLWVIWPKSLLSSKQAFGSKMDSLASLLVMEDHRPSKVVHCVEIQEYFYHSDFTWNQFPNVWNIQNTKHRKCTKNDFT